MNKAQIIDWLKENKQKLINNGFDYPCQDVNLIDEKTLEEFKQEAENFLQENQ